MILLFSGALLFLFLATSTGFVVNRKFFPAPSVGLLENLLTGTAVITVYLNTLSIFLPTNWLLLVPVFFVAMLISIKTGFISSFKKVFKGNVTKIFRGWEGLIALAFLLPIVLYTFVPPYNVDSSGYHFLAILWNEQFPAVPGLANLFPQYGFNSSFFVLSAAFSFTDVTGQSIYPLNAVLILVFFLWILKQALQLNALGKLLICGLLFIFLRQFPINLASPSADPLASIIVFYVLFKMFFLLNNKAAINWRYLILLAVFALIIKLSTLPLLLVGLTPLFLKNEPKTGTLINYLKLLPAAVIILLPWLTRNIILTGYIVFPFPAADFFSFDWKVPLEVVAAEKLHIAHAPRLIAGDWKYIDSLPFTSWFPRWLPQVWWDNRFNFVVVIAALASPLMLLFKGLRKQLTRAFFALWLIAYAGVWFGIISSPDLRFSYHFMLSCIFFPLLMVAQQVSSKRWNGYVNVALIVVVAFSCIHYSWLAIQRLSPYSLREYVTYPLKSPVYFENNNLSTFPYVMLNKSIRLHISDPTHHNVNAPLPVCSVYDPRLRLRTNRLKDGFKIER